MDNSSSSIESNMYQIKMPGHRIAISVTAAIAAAMAMLLNSFIMYVIWKTPSLHKPSYFMIANLALTDFITGAVVLPLNAVCNIAAILNCEGIFRVAWLWSIASGFWMGAMSFYIITVISIDRLLAIRLKNRYRGVVTLKRTGLVLIFWWVVGGMIVNSLFLIFRLPIDSLITPVAVYQSSMLITLTACFSMSFYSLKKISSTVGSSAIENEPASSGQLNFNVNKYQRSLHTMILVFLCVMLFFAPYVCSNVVSVVFFKDALNFDPKNPLSEPTYKLLNGSEIVFLMNSSVNPLLYLWRIKDVRVAAVNTLRKILRQQTTGQDNL